MTLNDDGLRCSVLRHRAIIMGLDLPDFTKETEEQVAQRLDTELLRRTCGKTELPMLASRQEKSDEN